MHCIICEDELLLRRIDICEVSRCLIWHCEDEWYHMHCVVVESHCIILIDLVDDVYGCMVFQVCWCFVMIVLIYLSIMKSLPIIC